jgi:hypothetical protein
MLSRCKATIFLYRKPHLGDLHLQFADAAGRGVELTPPPFRQADMPNLRIKVTADILAGKVA